MPYLIDKKDQDVKKFLNSFKSNQPSNISLEEHVKSLINQLNDLAEKQSKNDERYHPKDVLEAFVSPNINDFPKNIFRKGLETKNLIQLIALCQSFQIAWPEEVASNLGKIISPSADFSISYISDNKYKINTPKIKEISNIIFSVKVQLTLEKSEGLIDKLSDGILIEKKNLETLNFQNRNLSDDLKVASDQIEFANKKILELENKILYLENRVEESDKTIKEKDEKHKKLSDGFVDKSCELISLKYEKALLDDEFKRYKNENDLIQKNNELLEKEIEENKKTFDSLKQSNLNLTVELGKKSVEITNKDKNIKTLESRISEKDEKIKKLEEKIKEDLQTFKRVLAKSQMNKNTAKKTTVNITNSNLTVGASANPLHYISLAIQQLSAESSEQHNQAPLGKRNLIYSEASKNNGSTGKEDSKKLKR